MPRPRSKIAHHTPRTLMDYRQAYMLAHGASYRAWSMRWIPLPHTPCPSSLPPRHLRTHFHQLPRHPQMRLRICVLRSDNRRLHVVLRRACDSRRRATDDDAPGRMLSSGVRLCRGLLYATSICRPTRHEQVLWLHVAECVGLVPVAGAGCDERVDHACVFFLCVWRCSLFFDVPQKDQASCDEGYSTYHSAGDGDCGWRCA